MHFTEYDTRLASYAVIVDERDRILLSWFNGSAPGWTMPGGGVEFGETCEQAAVREVLEETGYTAELGELLAIDVKTSSRHEESGRPSRSVRAIYRARITGGELGTLEIGGTTDRAEWIPLDELDDAGPRVDLVDTAISAWRSSSL